MKAIGSTLFLAQRLGQPLSTALYNREIAAAVGLPESWFRDAIYANPELIVEPCREAGRVAADETWLPWATEWSVGSGPMDVLLLSSFGRIGIVETKLSYNRERRREVVAQVLDYALALQETSVEDLPELPKVDGGPTREDVEETLSRGRFLLVIAGDRLDPRALRLSEALLAAHLTAEWDLAMVDLNLYRSNAAPDSLLIVPELRGSVYADARQVVQVTVEGETPKARIKVTRLPSGGVVPTRTKFESIDQFLQAVDNTAPELADAARAVVESFRTAERRSAGRLVLQLQTSSANLYWKAPSGVLRRICGLNTSGRFRVRLSYVLEEGRPDVADAIRASVSKLMAIPSDEVNGTVYLDRVETDAVLGAIGRIMDVIISLQV